MARYNSVSFDTAELSRCASEYRKYSEELEAIKKALDEAMNQLVNTYWVGGASLKFKQVIGDQWLDTVKRYSELLYDLTIIMDDVVRTYENLLDQAKQVRV